MRRRGEDRIVQHILPVAGELLPSDHAGFDRVMPAATGGEDHLVADLQPVRIAHLQRRQVELPQRLDQAEAALLVIRQRMARGSPGRPMR